MFNSNDIVTGFVSSFGKMPYGIKLIIIPLALGMILVSSNYMAGTWYVMSDMHVPCGLHIILFTLHILGHLS